MGTGTDEKRGLLRRVVRWLQRPTITLVLLAVLGVDLITLEPGGTEWAANGSTAAHYAGSLVAPHDYEERAPPPSAYFGWNAAEDDIRPVTIDEGGFALAFVPSMRRNEWRTGFWGITRHETTFTFDLGKVVLDPSVLEPPDLEDRARQMYAATLFEHGDPLWIDAMHAISATGGTEHHEVRWLWPGFARNAASAAGWLLLLASLGWMARPFAERRWWRRLGAGRCAACRYEIGADGYARPCPECGVVGRDGYRRSNWCATDRALARFTGVLSQPIVTVLLLVILLGDVLLLPVGKNYVSGASGSTLRRFVPIPALRADAGNGVPNDTLYIGIVQTPEGDTAYSPTPGETYVAITWWSWSHGLYAPIQSMQYVSLHWNDGRDHARDDTTELEDYLRSIGKSEWADALVRQRDYFMFLHGRPRWTGYAHNAAALCGAAMLVLSVRWIPMRVRARRARERGRCWYCAVPAAAGACRVCGRAALGA